MKFVSYNIQFGIGRDGIFDPRRIAASLEGADVIALQEVTRGHSGNGGVDLAEVFGALFPLHHRVFDPAADTYLDSRIEGGQLIERRYQFGNMVLSRWPILAHRHLLLPRGRTYDVLNLQRGASEAVIVTPGGPFRVYSTHLDHVSPDERIAQIRYLKARALNHVAEGGALTGGVQFGLLDPPLTEDFVMMGDFNMVPESPEYIEMLGPRDLSGGRILRADRPFDALSRAGAFGPDSYSWMDPGDDSKRMHLDYCFLNAGLACRLKSAHVDTGAMGSDHFPLWVEIE